MDYGDDINSDRAAISVTGAEQAKFLHTYAAVFPSCSPYSETYGIRLTSSGVIFEMETENGL